jgi:hypothetical protein
VLLRCENKAEQCEQKNVLDVGYSAPLLAETVKENSLAADYSTTSFLAESSEENSLADSNNCLLAESKEGNSLVAVYSNSILLAESKEEYSLVADYSSHALAASSQKTSLAADHSNHALLEDSKEELSLADDDSSPSRLAAMNSQENSIADSYSLIRLLPGKTEQDYSNLFLAAESEGEMTTDSTVPLRGEAATQIQPLTYRHTRQQISYCLYKILNKKNTVILLNYYFYALSAQ